MRVRPSPVVMPPGWQLTKSFSRLRKKKVLGGPGKLSAAYAFFPCFKKTSLVPDEVELNSAMEGKTLGTLAL